MFTLSPGIMLCISPLSKLVCISERYWKKEHYNAISHIQKLAIIQCHQIPTNFQMSRSISWYFLVFLNLILKKIYHWIDASLKNLLICECLSFNIPLFSSLSLSLSCIFLMFLLFLNKQRFSLESFSWSEFCWFLPCDIIPHHPLSFVYLVNLQLDIEAWSIFFNDYYLFFGQEYLKFCEVFSP